MKSYLYAFGIILFILVLTTTESTAQGCVAVRNMSSCSTGADSLQTGTIQFSLNYRYFRSYKHFRGKHEETNRVKEGSEVINNDNSVILGIGFNINRNFSVAVNVPYLNIDRSSLYEHYGNPSTEDPTINPRFHTQSQGIGDVRIAAYLHALRSGRINLQVGAGLKLPTGDYNVKDYFHKKGSQGQDSLVYRVVDQSIQTGDGGFGFTTELNASYMINHSFSAYGSALYLFNPRNTNGVLRSSTLSSGIPLSNEFSVVDQFLFRAGATYSVKNFDFSVGGRYEGIPSEDIIGKSDGFRRPGYIVSMEPSIAFTKNQHRFGVNFPIALERNRTQSVLDKKQTEITGVYRHGDAAFADWLLSVSYTYTLRR
jgi:hypothetical protein